MKLIHLFPKLVASLKTVSVLACILVATGCADGSDGFVFEIPALPKLVGCADTDSCVSNPPVEINAERPAAVQVPADYNTATRYPLIIVLHGIGVSAAIQSAYMGLDPRVDSLDFVLIKPNGMENGNGSRFWNATLACCAFTDEERQIDDVAYIRGLIVEAAATYSIDVDRIGLIGHSNGGFLTLRLVCEVSDLVTAAVSLAGSTWKDDTSCAPTTLPVSVLALHGTNDNTIPYDGSELDGFIFPGAQETISRFAAHAGCDTTSPVMEPNLDVDGGIAGAETLVLAYEGCAPGVDVTLWTMVGSPHIPVPWVSSAQDGLVNWILDHPRI